MSRIGYKEIDLPEGVEISQQGNIVTVKGPKGTLSREISPLIKMSVEGNVVKFDRDEDSNQVKMVHGTTRANVNNMVEGVVNGFSKTLKLVGVGYRAQFKGNKLILTVGYSQPVEMDKPEDVDIKVPDNTTIELSSINKQHLGDFAALVRAVRSPEPYKGKGIRYENEHIIRKEGKTGK
ncbi:50S ribosomal protein L6 [Limosilactobacillus vaginalis]|jgi:large subunit ribosomal protein L6|uniref:Large ribosomal subunit protein uL6 n=2 Tax=Limosilactobacillus vaginalis TaxID=1633 RepID=A0AAP3GS42_9LACO|nr:MULTISPECIES: 50S ribosomal protein L6 [Limosilactobacillus]PEH04171.1 50S ribosomal protein L6 [Lactobacillus sp. UMNPBX5]EEJ40186.1 ribosomal protein L6 [Limosilactobacillus vaginalis DSM 5837 = ATCC 49540]KRM48988.1 ribosomal protein L6 [Limosilactobacillus vaginalis DSM 5837 = ATCC 49540]MCI6853490.1 50S ribosomal protein L6 [Limosilactobacillus vaginalis]MCZ2466186.1 50S ribosomal protein L6 [Limosilactobacillus vaginalis]